MVRAHALRIALLCALLVMTSACEEPNYTPEQAAPYVDTWAKSIGPVLREEAETTATSAALGSRLREASASDRKRLNHSESPYDVMVEEVYAARKYKTALVKKGALTKRGELVLEALTRAGDDGFKVERFRLKTVRANLKQLKELRTHYARLADFAPGKTERDFVTQYVTARKPSKFQLAAANYAGINKELLTAPAGEGLRKHVKEREESSAEIARLEAEVEHTLARGILRYAKLMKYDHLPSAFVHPRHDDYFNDAEAIRLRIENKRRRGRRVKERASRRAGLTWRHASAVVRDMIKHKGVPILRERAKGALKELLEGDAAKTLANLSPDPRYTALRKEYVRYRTIAEQGDWKPITPGKRLRRGRKHASIRALKLRLQKEGYYPASDRDPSDLFDAHLTDAIKAYEQTHQMKVDGKLSKGFWRSVNVPAARRARQIMRNMERWRKSDVIHSAETYVLINIPDYHVEIWKNQKRALQMRVVVGNNDLVEDDEQEKWVNPNRTPTLSAFIDRVIYNPYWTATPRIREEEILLDVRKLMEQEYEAKMLKLLGFGDGTVEGLKKLRSGKTTAAKPAATGAASPMGAAAGTAAGTPAAKPAAPAAKLPRLLSGKRGHKLFDVETFKRKYQARHGQEPDMKALFPYLDVELGELNVSVTDPDNIPSWYEKNGYEVRGAGKKWEYVRQLPGNENSLGRVKVIFPNEHDVYLHDTPFKGLFGLTIRAKSHGCMRLHRPLKFARWILENDGQYDRAEVRKKLKEVEYKPIFLKKPIPVHVIYHTVSLSDEGRAVFLLDIYDKDNPRPEKKWRKKRKSAREKRRERILRERERRGR